MSFLCAKRDCMINMYMTAHNILDDRAKVSSQFAIYLNILRSVNVTDRNILYATGIVFEKLESEMELKDWIFLKELLN